jgi:hypothetical protein
MLGGRVLAEKVRSTYMGKPFEGYGLTGYVSRSSGHLERQHGHRDHVEHRPVRRHGRLHPQRLLHGRDDQRKEDRAHDLPRRRSAAGKVHEFFEKGPDGQEFKSMELIYTRR